MDLNRLTRGERFVMLAGGFLLLDLVFFPWHKLPAGFFVFTGGDPTRTALQAPNSLQGTLAFLVAVGMVTQVIMNRYTSQRVNPSLIRLQPPAGMAVLGLLAWKLALETAYLSVGAYLGMVTALLVAYGGLLMSKDPDARR
jgi:hypothetical protein